jgi:hypothetical protein
MYYLADRIGQIAFSVFLMYLPLRFRYFPIDPGDLIGPLATVVVFQIEDIF